MLLVVGEIGGMGFCYAGNGRKDIGCGGLENEMELGVWK